MYDDYDRYRYPDGWRRFDRPYGYGPCRYGYCGPYIPYGPYGDRWRSYPYWPY